MYFKKAKLLKYVIVNRFKSATIIEQSLIATKIRRMVS